MGKVLVTPSRYRFGVFEADPASGELRKQGSKVRLTEQSFRVLLALLERPGELVTRRQLQERLWNEETFVDFDASLNTAVSVLRDALGDSAKSPRFIETLPRRGYRFLADVQQEEPRRVPASEFRGTVAGATPHARPAPHRAGWQFGVVLATLVLLSFGGLSYLYVRARAVPVDSIAVLPLVYAGPQTDGDQEHLADGLTSALITELARLGVPNVISETSVMQYKRASKPLPTIAHELGADVLVEGSVLREGNSIRVNAQLIDARTDKHLWAQSYQREMQSMLQLQDEIARAIVGEIRTRLTPSVRTAPVRRSVNAQAQEAYLRGRHALRTEIEEHRRRAAEFFEEAIRLDPAFAVAYQGLADYYGATDAVSPEAAASNARKYALKALELEPTLASAHSTLAQASMWADWDWPVAEREFERSLDLDPNDAATRRWYGLFLDVTGRPRAASAQLRRARELDPVSPMTYFALSHHLFLARRFDEAIAQARIVEEISPHDPAVIESLGSLYGVLGDHDRAVATFERGIVLWGRDPALVFGLALAQAAAGSRDGAKRLLDELYEAARRRYVPPVWFARVHMALGDRDLAFEWMEKGFQARDGSLVHLKVSPIFDRIRGDARFPDLLRRMNFPRAAPDS